MTFALWEPPLLDETTGLRRSANTESATWLAAAVEAGVRTLCFTRSRKSASQGSSSRDVSCSRSQPSRMAVRPPDRASAVFGKCLCCTDSRPGK